MKTHWPIHDQAEIDAVAEVLRSGATNYWQQGGQGRAFESEFAAYTGAYYALTCSNGTTALELAVGALKLAKDHRFPGEIICPARTFVATASAVMTNGLRPVLADIDAETLNVTVKTLEARYTPHTKAVIVVHYAGLPCDMHAICEWAWERGLVVIEDAAHGHSATIGGRHVGTFGDIGCFSFCVGKIMSTGGEGGMVITNKRWLYDRMRARRDHGRYSMVGSADPHAFQYTVAEPGTNARLTEMQSAIGRAQLKKLDGWVARRREIAARYDAELDWKVTAEGHSHYMYIGRVTNWKRPDIIKNLNARGIPARIGGCANIGKEAAFQGIAQECPVADAVGERTLSLPIYPTMSDADCDEVIAAVREELANA